MRSCKFILFARTFRISCFICAFSMVMFWCFKYSKDEDLCLVSYKTFQKNDDSAFPVLSMCFQNPIIESKLREIGGNINTSAYIKFLKGEIYDEQMVNIDYSNVSMALSHHHLSYEFVWKNGSKTYYYPMNVTGEKIDSITYNGDWMQSFNKCFGLNLNSYYVGNINYFKAHFKQNMFPNSIRPSYQRFVIIVHQTQQIFQSARNAIHNWQPRADSKYIGMKFRMKNIEVLRQRNKQSKPCIEDSHNQDSLWLHDKIKVIGCRAPYHTLMSDMAAICQNKEKMKSAYISLSDNDHNKYYPSPCQTMSNIAYAYEEYVENGSWGNGSFKVIIIPTDTYKMIEQSKAIDMQALIGNIGGYIGLFLGK